MTKNDDKIGTKEEEFALILKYLRMPQASRYMEGSAYMALIFIAILGAQNSILVKMPEWAYILCVIGVLFAIWNWFYVLKQILLELYAERKK